MAAKKDKTFLYVGLGIAAFYLYSRPRNTGVVPPYQGQQPPAQTTNNPTDWINAGANVVSSVIQVIDSFQPDPNDYGPGFAGQDDRYSQWG